MKLIAKTLSAFALAATLVGPALAQDTSIAGMWQMKDGLSDYEVTLCGTEGTSVCVKAVALRGKADSARNRPYLNAYIVEGAKQTGANRWKGKLKLWGQTADSTIKLLDANNLIIQGCAFLVVCDELELKRLN